jgi:Tfp pilus assembly protein PilF
VLRASSDSGQASPAFDRLDGARKARRLGPDAPGVPLGLATSYEALGRSRDAVREYEEYLKMRPNSGDAERVRARIAALNGGRP